jgi:hypothetical protein
LQTRFVTVADKICSCRRNLRDLAWKNTKETNKSKEEERIQEIDKRGGDKGGEEEAAP